VFLFFLAVKAEISQNTAYPVAVSAPMLSPSLDARNSEGTPAIGCVWILQTPIKPPVSVSNVQQAQINIKLFRHHH
jgi:hypothetical protein